MGAVKQTIGVLFFLSETRKHFRLMLLFPLSQKAFFNIYGTTSTRVGNFKFYHSVALDSLYISTGNDVTSYFLWQHITQTFLFFVMFWWQFLDNG